MSVIKYSFNTQLSILCRSLSYLAFGIKIPTSSPLLSLNLTYKSDIARNVYERYRQDGFKYADQGITPKAIAQQMGDLEWKIDQFGCFLFRPTQIYQDRIRKMLIQTGRYEHQTLLEAQDSIKKQQRQTHYFDYYIDNKTTLSELRRLVHLQCKARVFQQLNKHEVHRRIYTENLSSQQIQIIKNIQPILFQMQNLKIMPLSYLIQQNKGLNIQTENHIDLGNKKFRYFACNGQSTIHFQKLLPRHKLINIYAGNEQMKIINLNQKDLLQQLKNQPKGLKKKNLFNMQLNQKINIQDLILIYGNLIDMHNFGAVQELLDKFEIQFQGVQQYKILRGSYNYLTQNKSNL